MEDKFANEYKGVDNSFYDEETNSIEWIDLENWDRKRLFYNYLGTDFPYIIMTANIDVTKPLAYAHAHGVSFNLVMVYLCNKTVDSIVNYRYRFIDGKPFVIDHTRPTVNHLKPGEDIFVIGEGPWPCDDIDEFCRITHENQMKAQPDDMQGRVRYKMDIINYTSVPWVSYTGFIRTIIHNGVDNTPKFSFGKYFKEGDRVLMPVSNQTHHGLMDGRHVGMFFERFQKACDEIEI